jgi:hypothetical protein
MHSRNLCRPVDRSKLAAELGAQSLRSVIAEGREGKPSGFAINVDKRRCSREEFWLDAKSPSIKLSLGAVCSLRGQGESWSRTWVPRLWDQGRHSHDPLRSAKTAPLPGRRRDHFAVLTINGLLQWNRYQTGLRSNHPYIAHRTSKRQPTRRLRSGGRLPGQSFEFRDQLSQCFEISDCCH